MEKEKLEIVLMRVLETPDNLVVHYRYQVGDLRMWIGQDRESGDIYSIGLVDYAGKFKDFELSISLHKDEVTQGGWPDSFEVRPKSYGMATGNARDFAERLKEACDMLDTIEAFLQTSKHYELYAEKHGIEIPKGQELEGADGGFPTLEEIRRDYRELMGIIGDVRTVAQAWEVAEKYGLQVRIKGAGADIESLHIRAYGCLRSIYHALDGGAPEFDVWSNGWNCIILPDITEDDLTEENYRDWIEMDFKPVGDEMISRKFLLGEIQEYFERKGAEWVGDLDEDCKRAWGIVQNFRQEDGDLVSRDRLVDALQCAFGCDLAYLGRDLQFFQDAIVGVPAASKGDLDALISDAERKCSAENKGLDNGKLTLDNGQLMCK